MNKLRALTILFVFFLGIYIGWFTTDREVQKISGLYVKYIESIDNQKQIDIKMYLDILYYLREQKNLEVIEVLEFKVKSMKGDLSKRQALFEMMKKYQEEYCLRDCLLSVQSMGSG